MTKAKDLGKFLCYVLRHKPTAVPRLSVDDQGWANILPIIDGGITLAELEAEVQGDTKGRYEMKQTMDGTFIRCGYGHSLPHVNIKVGNAVVFPEVLYHGTTVKAAESIMRTGLKSMGRQEVCMATTPELAYSNGIRYAKSVENLVIFTISGLDTIEDLKRVAPEIWCAKYVPASKLQVYTKSL